MLTTLLAVAVLTACTNTTSQRSSAGPTPAKVTQVLSCTSAIRIGPLPVWARAGFSPPDQPVPQVTGLAGSILGVVFANPLLAPPTGDHGNKILWLAAPASSTTNAGRSPSPDLKIHATLNGSHVAVDRQVTGGPGPSLIDMPLAGCWTFALSWSGHHDSLAVPYLKP